MICAIRVNAGGTGSYWEHFGSRELKCKELEGTSRRSNVVTSQRRDVGSTKIEVNKRQRRDISTSRRQHKFYLSIIKSKKRDQNSGHRDTYGLGHGKQRAAKEISEEDSSFCIFLLS